MTLSDLKDQLDASQCGVEAQTITLIIACIEGGTTAGKAIVKAVSELGIPKRYVGMTLNNNRGPSAERYRWFKGGNGLYNLHE